MKKEFVPYELALKLKELGFDEPCFGYYVDGELRGINLGIEELGGVEPYYQRFGFHALSNHNVDNQNKIVVTAPTFSQAFRWFRDNFEGIQFEIVPSHWKHKYTGFYHINAGFLNLETMEMSYSVGAGGFETYDEAELACLEKLIEIVENNK